MLHNGELGDFSSISFNSFLNSRIWMPYNRSQFLHTSSLSQYIPGNTNTRYTTGRYYVSTTGRLVGHSSSAIHVNSYSSSLPLKLTRTLPSLNVLNAFSCLQSMHVTMKTTLRCVWKENRIESTLVWNSFLLLNRHQNVWLFLPEVLRWIFKTQQFSLPCHWSNVLRSVWADQTKSLAGFCFSALFC